MSEINNEQMLKSIKGIREEVIKADDKQTPHIVHTLDELAVTGDPNKINNGKAEFDIIYEFQKGRFNLSTLGNYEVMQENEESIYVRVHYDNIFIKNSNRQDVVFSMQQVMPFMVSLEQASIAMNDKNNEKMTLMEIYNEDEHVKLVMDNFGHYKSAIRSIISNALEIDEEILTYALTESLFEAMTVIFRVSNDLVKEAQTFTQQ